MTPSLALCRDVVARFGTPVYVYDLDLVSSAQRDLFAALPDGFEVFYAVKANPHPDIVRTLGEASPRPCGAEVSSEGELAVALAAGHPAEHCLYTGPGKTATELRRAMGAGVRLFSAESLTDLEHIGEAAREHGVVVECLLRVNDDRAHAATGIRMTGRPSQFGTDATALPDLVPDFRKVPGTRVVGLHFFALSNAREEAGLIAEFDRTLTTAARLRCQLDLPVRLLDIGGGFAAPYAKPGERPVYRRLRAELTASLDRHFPQHRAGDPRLICESGRYLVAASGTLLCGVRDVKRSQGRTYAVLDAGINALGGLSGLGRLLPVQAVPCGNEDGPLTDADLVGPLCTPGDVLGRQVRFPVLRPGDVMAIPNVGAYGLTASLLAFLGRTAPAEVVVRNGAVVSASRLRIHRFYLGASGTIEEPSCPL